MHALRVENNKFKTQLAAFEGVDIDVAANALVELQAAAKACESCLLLLELYSNFDLPVFHYLLRKAAGAGPAWQTTP